MLCLKSHEFVACCVFILDLKIYHNLIELGLFGLPGVHKIYAKFLDMFLSIGSYSIYDNMVSKAFYLQKRLIQSMT